MYAVDGLRFRGWIELWFHDISPGGGSEIETESPGANGYEHDAGLRIDSEGVQGRAALGSRHAAVKPGKG